MKTLPAFASVLALSLSLATPTLAHVGHGDEFQASGGVNRVEVKFDTDALLGIQVNPIEAAADEGSAVLIPVTALVDDNGRQLVFVQYDNFYEPVDVVTGETQGELIEVTEGLSVGEQLVSQGSLSLYAESRKTQAAEAPDTALKTTTETTIIEETTEAPVADASAAQTTEEPSSGFPVGIAAALAAIAAVGAGAVLLLKGKNSKKDFS
ncbi:MAG: cobalt transporter [Cyanobacteria bacterium J06634_6]